MEREGGRGRERRRERERREREREREREIPEICPWQQHVAVPAVVCQC